ncbi:MAG: methyl-accepting chemotaxis protein [Ectothiorhodospiraceae bacterium]|nr:methyl-accepting chemotaxis protein [Ectothiorhodospiraceae bacterium]
MLFQKNQDRNSRGGVLGRVGIMKKALIAPAFLIIVLAVVGTIALQAQLAINRDMDRTATDLVPASETGTQLATAVYRERLAAERFSDLQTQEQVFEWEESNQRAGAAIADARRQLQDSRVRGLLQELQQQHRAFTEAMQERVIVSTLDARRILDQQVMAQSGDAASLMEVLRYYGSGGGGMVEDMITEILGQMLATQVSILRYVDSGEVDELHLGQVAYERVMEDLELLGEQRLNNMQVDTLERATELWGELGQSIERMHNAITVAETAMAEEMRVIGPEMSRLANEVQRSVAGELSGITADIMAMGERNTTTLLALLIGSALAGALVAWFLTRGYVRPLVRLNGFVDEMITEMDAGNGDLTKRVEVVTADEVGELGGNVNRFIETLQRVLTTIHGETQQLASAAEELSAVTAQTTEGVNRQRGETEQVATAMNQMTATVQEIARNATDASTAAGEANESAVQGRRVVITTVEAINALVEAVQDGQRTVNRLGQDAESITEVIDVITGIAEQTNLLALNAAIEAARAGQEGRGFAVVAAEVRELAGKTQESTGKIQELIENLQRGSRGAVEVMEKSASRGQETVTHAAEAGSALERIEEQVRAINDMNAQIASAAEEQTAVSNDISQSVERIRGVADESSQGADQTARASEELARLSERLNRLVNQFRI